MRLQKQIRMGVIMMLQAAVIPSAESIITDTDNTGQTLTAFYGDIIFKSAPGALTQ